jgi:hypothetical protein
MQRLVFDARTADAAKRKKWHAAMHETGGWLELADCLIKHIAIRRRLLADNDA